MPESPQARAPDPSFGGSVVHGEPPRWEAKPLRVPAPLSALIGGLEGAEVRGDPSSVVTEVVYRSADATAGSLFFCVPGTHVDGHEFAGDAVRRGAATLVVDRWVDQSVAQARVPSVRAAMGPMSAAFFGKPSERMLVLGVTGTNGKTTTTYLLESILSAAGVRAGVIGTTGVRIDGRPLPFDRTTPEAPDLQRLLASMGESGVGGVAMEVSSHGLEQRRVDGTRYACAVFTNLSQDHLDYHGTMEAYFDAKARLFEPDLSRVGVVNADTEEGRTLARRARVPVVTFGLTEGVDVRGEDPEVTDHGLAFRVGDVHISSPLRAHFNVSNCLGAFAAARQVGIDDAAIAAGIERLGGVPGRLEPVDAGQPFGVLVDYAHTPDSVDNVLRAARKLTDGRVIALLGCGGDRDRAKRPLMGEAATRLADLTLITSDNPRSERPEDIIAEIVPGAEQGGGEFVVEPDRRAAIRAALAAARPGDVVVLAGKGHETGQEFEGGRTIPFDDRIVAAEELAALMGASR